MKKLMIAACLLLTIGMTSCDKTYTCTCHYYGGGVQTSVTDVKASNYSKANDKCQAYLKSSNSLDCTLQQ